MVIIIGRSGSGKTSVVNELVKNYGYNQLITDTTRPKRPEEKNGIDYNFKTQEEFDKLKDEDYYAESVTYNASFGKCSYGSQKSYYENPNKNSIIILNPIGFYKIKNNEKLNKDNLTSIYLKVLDDDLLLTRLVNRDDDPEEIKRRWAADSKDFADIEKNVDYIIEIKKGKTIKDIAKEIDKLNNRKKD